VSGMDTSPNPAPLKGVLVLELSKILAGPFVSQCLSDMGADVIKIEHPNGGDPTRKWGPPFAGADATYNLAINRNKKSVTLDLTSDDGRQTLHRLLERADVVIDNFRPGSSLARELHGADLVKKHPHVVALHLSAFGDDGPLRDEPGYDMVAQAAAGLMSLTGEPDGPPVKAAFPFGDLGAAMFGLAGVLAALYERTKTGRGQYVTTSLFESQLAFHAGFATNFFATGVNPPRLGSGHPSLVPYQVYPTKDGYLVIAVGNDRQFSALCRVLGVPDAGSGADFATNADRVRNRDRLNALIERRLSTDTTEQWHHHLRDAGVPSTPVQTLAEVYESEQTAALGMITTVDRPVTGPIKQIAFPVTFDGHRPRIRTAPPILGQHTAEVLQDLANHTNQTGTETP
jgi:crotonobetainyl-CoA:carnitine CoA-transferase CaiB-like acyl-CoA transferase